MASKTAHIHTIGVVGQGFVGKNYADALHDRGYNVIRYSLEKEYQQNRDQIRDTDVVIIAVPTPTKNGVFDISLVRDALTLCREGQTVVIKSTVQMGATAALQKEFPELKLFHVPEFLREAFAREDVEHPIRVVIGMGVVGEEYRTIASSLVEIFPAALHTSVTDTTTAEFIKYTHNTLGYMMIVYTNVLYDLAATHNVEWAMVKDAIVHNPWFPEKYLDPVHKSGPGAGGHCFIKDFAALVASYAQSLPGDAEGIALLRAIEEKNIALLRASGKDAVLLQEVYDNR